MSTATQFPSDRVWTPGEIGDAIGEDESWRRYEIVDGVLVVSPPPTPLHDLLAVRLVGALSPAVLDG
ncbi:MAG: Uma2 family endonuclease, partial [Jatrophihabitans endophyticus]